MIPTLEQLEPRECPSSFLSPADLAAHYGFAALPPFLNGAGQTIAIIDAYGDPTLQSDLAAFDARFGLPAPPVLWQVQTVQEFAGIHASTVQPTIAANVQVDLSQEQLWNLETALDVEYAHAMAPGANIIVLEVPEPSILEMMQAVQLAYAAPGISIVSMSWGMPDNPFVQLPMFPFDTLFDRTVNQFFPDANTKPMVAVASSGDSAIPEWPAVNPNVLGVGGTILQPDGSEIPWPLSGGGYSQFEREPLYQYLAQQTGQRSSPDVSYNAGTPIAIYQSDVDWVGVLGTSCGAPQWAALVSIMDEARMIQGKPAIDGSTQLLPLLYLLGEPYLMQTGVGRGSPDAAALVLAGMLP